MNVATRLGAFALVLGVAFAGAYGVGAPRAGDLAHLHIHPLQTGRTGPEISFDVKVPTPGKYRLFLDLQHGGAVRTASLTAESS